MKAMSDNRICIFYEIYLIDNNKFLEMRNIFEICSPDILGISESKLDDSFPLAQFRIENYKLYRQDRDSDGGGVMIYVKDSLPHRVIKEYTGVKYSIDFITIEIICILMCRNFNHQIF